MARTSIEIFMGNNKIDDITAIVSEIVKQNGYSEKLVNNEQVWAKGDGVLVKMQCFSLSFKANSFVLEGWMKDALTGESDLTGFVAMLPKKKMLNIMDQIKNAVNKNY